MTPAAQRGSSAGIAPGRACAAALLAAAVACACMPPGGSSRTRGAPLEPIRYARGFSDLATTRGFVTDPRPNRFSICHGNTCRFVATLGLPDAAWDGVRAIFQPAPGDAGDERSRVAQAIARLETETGARAGTWRDRGGNHEGRGEDGQMDCVDEANNSTVYLEMMNADGLLRWHRPGPRVSRGVTRLLKPHFTATLIEISTGARYAVDSWFEDNGAPPHIVPLADWRRGWKPADSAPEAGAELSRRD